MTEYKPLNLLNNKGFWPEKAAIADAIKEVLTVGKCRRPLPIRDFGRYRDPRWRNENNELRPYHSVDWYVCEALDEDRLQVDADRILQELADEPYRGSDSLGDHYDLFVMEEDMFDSRGPHEGTGVDYVVGRAQPMTAAVISTYRIEHIWGMPYSYLKTEVIRQLCFMFGVPSRDREDVVVEPGGARCGNVCALRPAHAAPDDWERLTEDRLAGGTLCEPCTHELRAFFERVARDQN